MTHTRQIISACGAAAAVAIIESLVVDWETLGGSLIVWVFLFPSIAGFTFLDWLGCRFQGAKDLAFLLSLVPVAGAMLYVMHQGGEGEDLAQIIGVWYVSEALVAYLLLLAMSPNRRLHSTPLPARRRSECANE